MIGQKHRAARKWYSREIMQHPPKRMGTKMHEYYHSEGYTDLDAIRQSANRRLTDKKRPEESMVHHHPKDSACDPYMHEEYLFGETVSESTLFQDMLGFEVTKEVFIDDNSKILTWTSGSTQASSSGGSTT